MGLDLAGLLFGHGHEVPPPGLLAPPRQGFNLLVWVVPFVAIGLGLVLVFVVLRRWSRRPASTAPAPMLDPAMRARIRRESSEGER